MIVPEHSSLNRRTQLESVCNNLLHVFGDFIVELAVIVLWLHPVQMMVSKKQLDISLKMLINFESKNPLGQIT